MGRGADTHDLAALLQHEVLRRLSGTPVSTALREQLRQLIRGVLNSPVLSANEERLVGHGPMLNEHLDGALSLRVQRALNEALAKAQAAGLVVSKAPMTAQVARAPDATSARRLATTIETTLTAAAKTAMSAAASSLVLADRTTFAALRESLTAAAFREGAALDAPSQPPAPGAIEVVQAEDALLHAAELLLRAHRTTVGNADPSAASSSADDPLVGQVLGGKYRIVRHKGRGGFGTVYEAVDVKLGATVAVKVLNERAARSPTALQEFLAEARRLTSLDHENIVRWITFDTTPEGLHYFVMEYLSGEELSKLLEREGRLDARRTTRILVQIVAALRVAHHRKDGKAQLHLDLKPQNVFIQPGDPEKVKVIDFGIGQHVGAEAIAAAEEEGFVGGTAGESGAARALSETDLERSLATRPSSTRSAVSPGGTPIRRARGGTILYASPEQCAHLAGHEEIVALDGRSDLYSLGVLAFRMLTGASPFEHWTSVEQGFKNHLEVPPRKVGSMGVKVPRKLAAFVDRCLVKDRDARWRDTEQAWAALQAIANPPVWPRLAAALALLLVAAVGITVWLRPTADLGTFQLRQVVGGRPVRVTDAPVYFGPSRLDVLLETEQLASGMQGGPLRLLRTTEPAAADAAPAVLADWTVAWADGGRVRLSPPSGQEFRGSVIVEAEDPSGRRQSTLSFRVVVLAPESWALESLDVPGRGERAVVDRGLELELPVRGQMDDLREVELLYPGGSGKLVVGAGQSSDGRVIYRQSLEDLGLPAGHATITARVTDACGDVKSVVADLEVVHGLLALDGSPELKTCRLLDRRWVVTPNSTPVLAVRLSRPASLHWAVLADGRTLAEDERTPALSHEVPVGRELFSEAVTGSLEVTFDESKLVLHSAATTRPGSLTASLAFTYVDAQPEFDVRLLEQSLGAVGDTAYLRDPSPHLKLARIGKDVPTRLEVDLVRESDGLPVDVPAAADLHLGLSFDDRLAELMLPLPEDGAYRLVVRGALMDGTSSAVLGEPTVKGPFKLVLDRSPPTLAVAAHELVVTTPGARPVLQLTSDDGATAGADSGELQLRRRLVSASSAGPVSLPWIDDVALPDAARTVDHAYLLELPSPESLGDGHYRLELQAVDAAGNVSEPVAVDLVLATRGPDLTVMSPGRAFDWLPSEESGRWTVRVRAFDPNGTAAVSALLTATGEPPLSRALSLERSDARSDDPEAAESEWSGDLTLDHLWSRRPVSLELTAEDLRGTRAAPISEGPIALPTIARERLDRIAIVQPGRPTTPMRLLTIDAVDDYLFHGRLDETENEDYGRWGLPRFNTKELPRSWKVRIPAGHMRDLYLDECEVAETEYLAFVRAADGWSDASHWPATPGTPARRDELAQRIARSVAAIPGLPVTNVTWDEAAAFAHWMGKRLPTLVEWEYAVRGGPGRYRPYASHPAPATRTAVNHDPELRGDGSCWPVRRSADVCALTELRDLCGNVSEWTSSPETFVASGARPPANLGRHFKENLGRLLAPETWSDWKRAPEFWVAGGSYTQAGIDFAVAQAERRQRERSDVGFRCAIPLADVLAAQEGQGALRVERLDP